MRSEFVTFSGEHINPLYKFAKSNNNNSKFIHIVNKILLVDESRIYAQLACGNQIGTQKKITFMVDNKTSPCKRCEEVKNKA